ncbi:MAG: citrate lyase acyl carrier protein [Theionarchaea archaeon]|nr:citrate lyase acyl carrier protein [Theionarchaea archaeon]MBU6999145.1 citrate lyase acyl carrier protein [Theionarchaea archaeon]MBU7019506.1 citrate lyase acyl carrier protein [Theionarchaea archaeon]MBU7034938.1 citrate lyase acyl carrier protein [Theionarchaea archaeon]MBU7040780.1 citrate lyase acyl carrier protein [Theionarchaea archaeon]
MNLVKKGKAGTDDDSDILVEVEPADTVTIELESRVDQLYGKKIREVIMRTLESLQVKGCIITAHDNGALDYTIRARVEAAVRLAGGVV